MNLGGGTVGDEHGGGVLGESGDEDDDDLEDEDVEFGEEALLLRNSSNLPRYALKNGSVISDLSASIRARFSPAAAANGLNDDILMLNRGAATGVSSRLWDTQAGHHPFN